MEDGKIRDHFDIMLTVSAQIPPWAASKNSTKTNIYRILWNNHFFAIIPKAVIAHKVKA